MGRTDLFRLGAILVLIAAFGAALTAIDRTPVVPAEADLPSSPPPDDLSSELRRCGALDLQDAEDARCTAVWEENRRRFFGRPARPLSSVPAAAPVSPALPPAQGGTP